MQERELQDFLYTHPEILFPNGKITESAKEYQIMGKRIDLLFMVDGIRYIVELKAKTIERDHIGQIIEYYGLMKEYLHESNLKMIVVAPDIPKFRGTFLEELGIRCIEIKEIPEHESDGRKIVQGVKLLEKKEKEDESFIKLLGGQMEGFTRDDFRSGITPLKVAKTARFLKDLLSPLEKEYSEFEITPYRINRAHSFDVDVSLDGPLGSKGIDFGHGDAWFAFRFGQTGTEPPNNVMYPTVFDVTVNAELHPSQEVMLSTIRARSDEFDRILSSFDDLMLKTYLKYEHQPRFYHWVPIDCLGCKEFNANFIIMNYEKHLNRFQEERKHWIEFIILKNKELTPKQIAHLRSKTQSLNFCHRLALPINFDDQIWGKDYTSQLAAFGERIFRLKKFISFFIG